jgi:phage repressor protein C with HTH and peptisase S24 domain
MALSHAQVWQGVDALAARAGLTPSALARLAGLDPTSFNRSKRLSAETPARPRWPSTESLAKVLQATGSSLADFAALADGSTGPGPRVPLIGMAQAGEGGFFDDAGLPAGEGWDEVEVPGPIREGMFALEVTGDSMAPLYRAGDRIVVDRRAEPRRGDRVALRTHAGEVMVKELARLTAQRLELRSLNLDYPDPVVARREIDWIARVLWASQ